MSIAADPLNILIVVADYYRHICDELVLGAIETLDSAKATHSLAVSYTHLDVYKRQILHRQW